MSLRRSWASSSATCWASTPPGAPAVLEVDEGYLGHLLEAAAPEVVVLLNLSRDQLDRISEVRMLADRWRTALGRLGPAGTDRPGTVEARRDTASILRMEWPVTPGRGYRLEGSDKPEGGWKSLGTAVFTGWSGAWRMPMTSGAAFFRMTEE